MFNVLPINSSAVFVSWRKPSEREAKGVIRGYQIFQSKASPTGERIGDPKQHTVCIDFYMSSVLKFMQPY